MKKQIQILVMALICCLSFCGCNRAVEGDKPGVAIINDCTITMQDYFFTEFGYFDGAPGAIAKIQVTMENNSNKAVSISDLAKIKVFSNGHEVSFACFDSFDDILPGFEKTYYYQSTESITVSKLLVQILDGSRVITEKEISKH